MEVNDFNTFQITKEDENKGQMYVTQKKRRDIQERTSDITEYLRELELVVTIEKGNPFTIPRISQLTQKTNQFNMTTRRYLEEEVKQMATDNKFLTLSVKVDDKFGDNGITGAVIIEKKGDEWRIDSFLLSCRVIGLKVEESILANILGMANKERAKILTGEFIPTDKNMPAKDFYKNNGFKLIEKIDGKTEIWQRDTTDNYTYPDFIKVIRK
jgi:FkbH-like protein